MSGISVIGTGNMARTIGARAMDFSLGVTELPA
jgi:hypothetical protein